MLRVCGHLITKKHRSLLENIQRRATKFILNYPVKAVAYTDRRLIQLNLLPLEFRRDIHDLVLLFKFKVGLLSANFERFLHPSTSRYATRKHDPANFLFDFKHRQYYFTNSYFPRSVKFWNNLPHSFKYVTTVSQFKGLLYEHYKTKCGTYRPP